MEIGTSLIGNCLPDKSLIDKSLIGTVIIGTIFAMFMVYHPIHKACNNYAQPTDFEESAYENND